MSLIIIKKIEEDKIRKYDMFKAIPEKARREYEEKPHEYRDNYQRDRDRIMYSKEFRRLSGKTQVFNASFDDNTRTRLTHTLEVAQIARTICDALGLNSTLAEAIAYGHDVGHTPFGHIGERTLNYIMNSCVVYFGYKDLSIDQCGFKHNLQSLKVLTELESISSYYSGLNLTKETLWGVVNHSKLQYGSCFYYSEITGFCRYKNKDEKCLKSGKQPLDYYEKYLSLLDDEKDWSIEGAIVALSDEIAQRHHDIEDGLFAGIIKKDDLEKNLTDIFEYDNYAKDNKHNSITLEQYISSVSKFIVDHYCSGYIASISSILDEISKKYDIKTSDDFYSKKALIYRKYEASHKGISKKISENNELKEIDELLQDFLRNRMLMSQLAQTMDGKAAFIIRRLYKAYLSNPQQLSDKTIVQICKEYGLKVDNDDPGKARLGLDDALKKSSTKMKVILLRKICDYIAGMTDEYAMIQYNKLYGTDIIKKSLN